MLIRGTRQLTVYGRLLSVASGRVAVQDNRGVVYLGHPRYVWPWWEPGEKETWQSLL